MLIEGFLLRIVYAALFSSHKLMHSGPLVAICHLREIGSVELPVLQRALRFRCAAKAR